MPEGILRKMEPARLADRWRVRIHCTSRCLWVIEDQGVVAGYVSIGEAEHPDLEPGFAGEIFELYVHPDHQRCGLGRTLLASALNIMHQRGRLWGVLEVLKDNHQARRFYESCGMQTDGQVQRRPAGLWCSIGGRRYSHANSAVRVVRYEIPLQPALREGLDLRR